MPSVTHTAKYFQSNLNLVSKISKRVLIYGELTVVLNPKKNTITESYHGRNQSLRERKNTSFSAIVSIYQTKEGPTVVLYENVFAEYGLNYSLLPDCIEHVRIQLT